MYNTSNVLRVAEGSEKAISGGLRQTLKRGDAVTFTDLPMQPVAIVLYNNTGNTTTAIVSYANEAPQSMTLDSVQAQGFSLGSAYFINPANTQATEIRISVPEDAQEDASIDVYAVSLFLPLGSVQNQEIRCGGAHRFTFEPDLG